MTTVRVDGLAIAYDLAGDVGAPIVFLHGVGSDRGVWRPQLADLGDDHRAVALDFRGHGASERPRTAIDRAAFARDVAGLLEALNLGAAHVVGLSMGGVVALELYDRRPDLVRSLVLADTFARFPGWEQAHARRLRDLDRLSMREIAEARIPSCLRPGADPAEVAEAVEQMARKDPEVYRESSVATWSPDYGALLQHVRVPTLVLWGEHDAVTPRALSEELEAGIPGARLVMIPDAGHISNLDNPAAFNCALREFLELAEAARTDGGAL